MKKEAAKFLLDVAKLLIGGVLLTGIMRQDISPRLLFLVGGITVALFVAAAFMLMWLSDKNEKK
jgi:hypothetical protein